MIRHKLQPVVDCWVRHCHAFLFYTLLLTLIASPVLTTLGFHGHMLGIFVAINLAAALMGIRNHRLSRLLLLLLSITITIRLVAESVNVQELMAGSTVILVMLGFIAVGNAVRSAISSPQISAEHLYAALSAYILAGILFGILHWEVGQIWPEAYGVPGGTELSLPTGIYFSFVTQATLGYGDVVPKNELARGIAILQAVAGQFYLVVMVARLVSLYVASPRAGQKQ